MQDGFLLLQARPLESSGTGARSVRSVHTEFGSLQVQVVPQLSGSSGAYFQGGDYWPCSVSVDRQGLTICRYRKPECTAAVETVSQAAGGTCCDPIVRWVPWPCVVEASEAATEKLEETGRSPPSHPHVARVLASVTTGRGGSGCPGTCVLYVSAESIGERRCFLSTLKVMKRQHFSQRCRLPSKVPPTSGDAEDIPLLSAARLLSRESTSVSVFSEPAQVNNPSRKCIQTKTAKYLGCESNQEKFRAERGVLKLATLQDTLNHLEQTNLEKLKAPLPLELPEVWGCISKTFDCFYRFSLCVDKLGLNLKPLVAADQIPESEVLLLRGAITGTDDQDLVLMTETISLPISAMLEVWTDVQSISERLRPPPPKITRLPFHTRPFDRCLGPWDFTEMAENDDHDTSDLEAATVTKSHNKRLSLQPPTPHCIGIRVNGAVAGNNFSRMWSRRANPCMMQFNTVNPPTFVVLSLASRSDADTLISRLQAYRHYSISVLLRSYITAAMNPCGFKTTGQSEDSQLDDDVGANSIIPEEADAHGRDSPPPGLPELGVWSDSHGSIPCMEASDDGQVVWHYPCRAAAQYQKMASVGPEEANAADALCNLSDSMEQRAISHESGPDGSAEVGDSMSELCPSAGSAGTPGSKIMLAQEADTVLIVKAPSLSTKSIVPSMPGTQISKLTAVPEPTSLAPERVRGVIVEQT